MRTRTTILSTALALVLTTSCFADPNLAANEDLRAVEAANNQFYAALNTLFTGDAEPMSQVWSHADDVTYMGPGGGFLKGWKHVGATWEEQAALKLGGKIRCTDLRITIGGNLAFAHCYEEGSNIDAEGQPLRVSIRATNLFRKENGEWKMVGHHTDLLPFLEKEEINSSDE